MVMRTVGGGAMAVGMRDGGRTVGSEVVEAKLVHCGFPMFRNASLSIRNHGGVIGLITDNGPSYSPIRSAKSTSSLLD